MSLLQLITSNLDSCFVILLLNEVWSCCSSEQDLWGTRGAFMWQLLQTWLMPAAVWLQSWDGMCCRTKLKFCKDSELCFQAYIAEVCSKAGKRNKLLQPVHLWKKGSFTCLHISSSKILKEFASCHIWPLFMRAEFLLPSCLVPAGFVCTVPCIPPLGMFLGCMLGWNSLHFTENTWWCNRINPRSGLIAFPFRVLALFGPCISWANKPWFDSHSCLQLV